MKKKTIKSLELNKKSISNLGVKNKSIRGGGKTEVYCTDGTYNCHPSAITRCDMSVCRCL